MDFTHNLDNIPHFELFAIGCWNNTALPGVLLRKRFVRKEGKPNRKRECRCWRPQRNSIPVSHTGNLKRFPECSLQTKTIKACQFFLTPHDKETHNEAPSF